LSTFVIFQLATPGTPIVYGAALGVIDARGGTFLEGAVETELMMAAMDQMGKYYGLPRMMAGCLTDANIPGVRAVIEKVLTSIPIVLTGTDVIQGIGLIEGSMTVSLEQMMIDEEIINLCMRMKEGIDTCDEKDYFNDIAKVSQGGHYLMQKSTRKAFRTDEFYKSKLINNYSYDEWIELGSPTVMGKAHSRVEEILKGDPVCPLEPGTKKIMMEIIEEAKSKL